LAAAVIASSLLLPDVAAAAPPSNDDFAAAAAHTIPTGPVSGTTVEATTEPGEPASANPGTVWYRVNALRTMYAGICVESAVGAVAEPFSGPSVQVLGAPGVEITPAVNAPLYRDLSAVRCPGGSGAMRYYSFNGRGERTVRVSSAVPGAFTLYVVDAGAAMDCADSAKLVKQFKKSVAQAKKRLRQAIANHAAAGTIKKLKKDLKRMKKKLRKETAFHNTVCSYV
jgi:hypothetical protein